jgi:hypothetical protein
VTACPDDVDLECDLLRCWCGVRECAFVLPEMTDSGSLQLANSTPQKENVSCMMVGRSSVSIGAMQVALSWRVPGRGPSSRR